MVIAQSSTNASVADDLSKPISTSADGHFLQQHDSKPFFWLGDTAWELFHRLDRDETDVYLKDRADKGFTVIQAVITGKVDVIGLDAPNRDQQLPFTDHDPSRPNEAYFAHIDWVVERARRYGLRMALLPVWGQAFVSGGGTAQVFNRNNAEAYGRWLGKRYRDKGIIWVLGGDVNPLWPLQSHEVKDTAPKSLVDYRPVYDAMAVGIKTGDGEDSFITYHPSAASPMGAALPRTSLYFADRDWLDMNMLQSSHFQAAPALEGGGDHLADSTSIASFVWNGTYNYLPISAEYFSSPVRPVIDGEPCYEDHPILLGFELQAKDFWQSRHVRGALYRALFAGAAGHTYGHFSVWDFYDPARKGRQTVGAYDKLFERYNRASWKTSLEAAGAQQMRHGKALMLSRPYFTRIPDQSVIVSNAGQGEMRIGATRDRTGAYLMVYLPQGQSVTVDLNKISGSAATGWWFDPRTGEAARIDGALTTNQPRQFVPPTNGPDQDWVLVIDDASKAFPAPGRVNP